MALLREGPEVQGADRMPRTVSISLRPQDASLIEGMKLEQKVNVAVSGILTSMNVSEYGCSVTIEVDSAGIAIEKPEPKKFIEQVETLKVLKS